MNYQKYKWKFRLLIIHTKNYTNLEYKKNKKTYYKYIKEFHKRHVKLLTNRNKNNDFFISLIGFDGKIKSKFNTVDPKKIFKIIDQMPLSKENFSPQNLSLFSDYKPETTIKGLGFKNKEKAIYTLEKIKTKSKTYQNNVVNTMIGRASNHPHKNKDMEEAIKIFKKWKSQNVKSNI